MKSSQNGIDQHPHCIDESDEINYYHNSQTQLVPSQSEAKETTLPDSSGTHTDHESQSSGSESVAYIPFASVQFDCINPSSYEFSCSDFSRSPSPIKPNRYGAFSPDYKRKSSRASLKISIPSRKQSNIDFKKKCFGDKYISLEKIGQLRGKDKEVEFGIFFSQQFRFKMQLKDFHNEKKKIFFENHSSGGSLGEVRRCKDINSQQDFAVKIICFKDGEHLLNISREFFLIKSLKHPNVIKAYDFFIENKKCYIIQEFVVGFSLSSFLTYTHRMDEEQAKFIVIETIKAIQYLSSKGVCHRDITCNNILIDERTNTVKLIDFSNSKSFDYARRMMTKTGTLTFMAPEIFKDQEYDKQVDLWSLGVVMFQILTGELPFFDENEVKLINDIQHKELDFTKDNPKLSHLSDEAINFLSCLLQKKPKKRITASNALNHPWLKQVNLMYEFKKLSKLDRSPDSPPRYRNKFSQYRTNQTSHQALHGEKLSGEILLKCYSPSHASLKENNSSATANQIEKDKDSKDKQVSSQTLIEDSENPTSHSSIHTEPNDLQNQQGLMHYVHAQNGKYPNNDTNFNSKVVNDDQTILDIRKRSRSSIFYAQQS